MGTPGKRSRENERLSSPTEGQESEGPIRYNDGCPPIMGKSGQGKDTVKPKDLCAAIDGVIEWLMDIREVVCAMKESEIKLKGKK